MPEVSGTKITVTKKATVIKLDQQPPIENNDLQDLFLKAPSFLLAEQHTPGQFNFNYRGLGNPQNPSLRWGFVFNLWGIGVSLRICA